MMIDRLIEQIKRKKNPCIVGIDPEWERLPECYRRHGANPSQCILTWAQDVIDAVADIVPAIKPQMTFFEVYGAEGVSIHQQVVRYAHEKGLLVIDDSKRNDISNTAKAYAYAHLASDGPMNADFMTVNPFLGSDSLEPFIQAAHQYDKGLFILVKTSNPSSAEISEAMTPSGKTICHWLAEKVHQYGKAFLGENGYASIGAVVGATYPKEAQALRQIMKEQFFLVPGFGAQGGDASGIAACFNEDGLGAVVSSSRGILYHYQQGEHQKPSRREYQEDVREQAEQMRDQVYSALCNAYEKLAY